MGSSSSSSTSPSRSAPPASRGDHHGHARPRHPRRHPRAPRARVAHAVVRVHVSAATVPRAARGAARRERSTSCTCSRRIIAPFAYGSAALAAKAGYPDGAHVSQRLRLPGARAAQPRVAERLASPPRRVVGGEHVRGERDVRHPQRRRRQGAAERRGLRRMERPAHDARAGHAATHRRHAPAGAQASTRPVPDPRRGAAAVGSDMRISLDIIGDGRERFFVDRLAAAAGADRVTRARASLPRGHSRDVRASDASSCCPRAWSRSASPHWRRCRGAAGRRAAQHRRGGLHRHGENGLLGEISRAHRGRRGARANEPLRAAIAARNRAAHPPFAWSDIVTAAVAQYERAAALQNGARG